MRWLWTWFGCGLSPVAPGTVGTLGALAVAWFAQRLDPGATTHLTLGAAVLVASALSLALQPAAARRTGTGDPKSFVLDEVAGMWLALVGQPLHAEPLVVFGGGFALFRLFDIWKPGPVRAVERWSGAVGVLADDLVAGLFANAVLFAAFRTVL